MHYRCFAPVAPEHCLSITALRCYDSGMVAISLFDALTRQDSAERLGGGGRATQLAAKLVEALLADWQRVRQFQEEFAPRNCDDPAATLALEKSIDALHETWAVEAEAVLVRLRPSPPPGNPRPASRHWRTLTPQPAPD